MPLDKQRFEATYAQFCRSQQIKPGTHVTLPDNRSVDLHQLHVEVMREGGSQSVTLRDLWAVIGGRMGIIQFPGNDSEPPRSGPVIAQHLQHTYKEYLQHFENAYVMTVKSRGPTPPQQQMQHMNSMPSGGNAKGGMLPGNPAGMPSNAARPNATPQLIAVAARFAHTSVPDMRAQGVPEHIITLVDRHRADLMKYQQQQQAQLIAKRNAEQEQQSIANTQPRFPNMHEQMSMGLQPGVQRSQQPNVSSTMPSIPAGEQKSMNAPIAQGIPGVLHKLPTHEQIQQAVVSITNLKQVFQQRLAGMAAQQIPDEQRLEYNQLLEQVYKMTSDLDPKLHMYFAVFKNEDLLRKYVAIVMTVAKQRHLVSASSPQYIVTLITLRNMQLQIQKLNEEFENRWRMMKMAAVAQQYPGLTPAPPAARPTPPAPLPPNAVQNMPQPSPSVPPLNGRQVSINPPPPQQSQSQSQPHIYPHPQLPSQSQLPPQTQTQSQPQPVKKPVQPPIPPSPSIPPASTSLASPTPPPPVATASTPVASALTPQTMAGSPQTPRSPKSKATAAKTKVAPRASRKPSATGKGPATPEAAPPSVAGVKRPPEDDVAVLTNAAPSQAEANSAPSPKKVKTEWEGEASDALVKKQQEIDNISTNEDATAFLDRMKELFAMTASTDNEIHNDIASTLDQILAGVAQEPADAAATAAALSVRGSGDAGPPPTALSPHMGPANDAFLEFLDFSSFTTLEDEDNDSKAPTPDLVPSSETNPSPESGSEGDSSGSMLSSDKIKIEEPGDHPDPLQLRSLREIDGGESAYFQADNWKWDGSMPTLDQPWAMFTS
ncbi:hypothetical protein BU15DRAFT_52406 [Melanogaster broomeanus]|nr:hypothetical protein BU15DRAFT_52406 [Melanogaster broomeanus]